MKRFDSTTGRLQLQFLASTLLGMPIKRPGSTVMVEWFNDNMVTIGYFVVGMLTCTAGGLLSLRPDPDKSKVFIPVYAISMAAFLFGLALVVWRENLWDEIASIFQ